MTTAGPHAGLASFLADHPGDANEPVVYSIDGHQSLDQLREAADDVATALRAFEVQPGQPVAVVVDSGISTLAAMFGIWSVGAVFVPVNGRLTDPEIGAVLLATNPAAVIARPGRAPGHDDRQVIEDPPLAWTPTADPHAATTAEPGGLGAALIMRTSGTTGAAKPIVLTHDGVRDGIDTILASLRSSRPAGDRPARSPMPNLIPSSLALWAGIWNALFALRAGAPVVLMDRFATQDFATLVGQHQIRSTVLAPAMMSMLVEDSTIADLSPLTMVRNITAPLTPQQARAFSAKFGIGVMNCYGQTELGSEVVGWTPAELKEFGEIKLGAVGRAHKGVELAILDHGHRPVEPGAAGEIWVHSPFASNAPEIAARLVDGFLRTGDIGRIDDEGFLWLEGRVSDMINRGGMKVMPQEVEDVLRTLPGVVDACVAGVPDARLGQVPIAWIRLTAGQSLSTADLLRLAREELAGYKLPVEIIVVDDFPRNDIGKVLRNVLVTDWVEHRHN